MELDVTILITTYGNERWRKLAVEVAGQSACQQALTWLYHADECESLGDARNQAVDDADPQGWICFLDADDTLEPGYMTAMDAAWKAHLAEHFLLVPAIKLDDGPARVLSERNIDVMNPCPIGTLIHRSTFELAGRFWDEAVWEDWGLWRRAWLRGAELVFVPDAVYNASRSGRHGRNHQVKNPKQTARDIRKSHDVWLNQ